MKYRLKKDLPFMKAGAIFKRAVTGGAYIEEVCNSEIGPVTRLLSLAQSMFMDDILTYTEWVEKVSSDEPLTVKDIIELLKEMPQDFTVRCEVAMVRPDVRQGYVLISDKTRRINK